MSWQSGHSASEHCGPGRSEEWHSKSEAWWCHPALTCGRIDDKSLPYDGKAVVVNFATMGMTFGKGHFDWDGVRRCLRGLKKQHFNKIIGTVYEQFRGLDRTIPNTLLPTDIENMCTIENVPRLLSAPNGDAS